MKSSMEVALVVLLAGLVSCDAQKQDEAELVDPRTIVTIPPDVPDDAETQMYVIRGLLGLIPHGDELMVMVYGYAAREARLREENVSKGQSSLRRWLADGKGGQLIQDGRYLRVPDLDDESGSRFYYFEHLGVGEWQFRAICAGAWRDDPNWPPSCDFTYPLREKVVSIRVDEPVFLSEHYKAIHDHVLSTMAKKGIQ